MRVSGWQANSGKTPRLWLLQDYCMDNCCRSRVPVISLPCSILARVPVKTIKHSVQQVLALHRGCIYPKSRVHSDIAYKFPRYSLRFASTGNLILVLIANVFILYLGAVSWWLLARPHQTFPRDSAYPGGCRLWNCGWVFVQCPRTLTMMLEEKTESYFKPFFPLIGLENSSDKSGGQRSLERHP